MLRFLTQKLRHQTLNEISPLPATTTPTNQPSPSPTAIGSLACPYDSDSEDEDDDDDKNVNDIVEASCCSNAALSAAAAAGCVHVERRKLIAAIRENGEKAEASDHQSLFVLSMATDQYRHLEQRASVEQLPSIDVTAQAPRVSADIGSKSRAKRKRPKLGFGTSASVDGSASAAIGWTAASSIRSSVMAASGATAMPSSNAGSRYCSSDSSDDEVVELLSGGRVTCPAAVVASSVDATAAAAAASDSAACVAYAEACHCCYCCSCHRNDACEQLDATAAVLDVEAERAASLGKAAVASNISSSSSSCNSWAHSDLKRGCTAAATDAAAADCGSGSSSSSSICAAAPQSAHVASIAVSPRKRPHCAGHVDSSLRLLRPMLRPVHQQRPTDDDSSRPRDHSDGHSSEAVIVSRPSLDLEKMHQKAAAFKRHYPRTIRIRCWNAGSNAGSCPMSEPPLPPSDFLFRSLDTVLVPSSHLTPVERPSACSV